MLISGMDTQNVLSLLNDYYSVANTLRRRGFDVKEIKEDTQVIQVTDRFYKSMNSFTFRQILKSIYDSTDLSHRKLLDSFPNIKPDALQKKLDEMVNENAISKIGNPPKYQKVRNKTYGRTLEWFVSEIIIREMNGIASSGIKLLNLKAGGDYDVVGRLDDVLIFIECKSGSIKNITEDHISQFIGRSRELMPSLSIFLTDTSGLTEDFRAVFNNAKWQDYGLAQRIPKKRRIKRRGTFYELSSTIYSVTNEGNLIANIKLAVNHYFNFVKPYGLIGPELKILQTHYNEYAP